MSTFSPDVSTAPPSPEAAPPRAKSRPVTDVTPVDQTVMEPPLPFARASARSTLAWTEVVAALTSGPRPRGLPPTAIVPPPVAPEASTLLPVS